MNLERVMDRPRLHPRAVAELMSAYMSQLLKCLTSEELELALLRNSLERSKVCHLHDYCDPNQLMIDAWDTVFDVCKEEQGCGETLDIQNSDHVSLLNAARAGAHEALSEVLV